MSTKSVKVGGSGDGDVKRRDVSCRCRPKSHLDTLRVQITARGRGPPEPAQGWLGKKDFRALWVDVI
jgi:hypothetical protein